MSGSDRVDRPVTVGVVGCADIATRRMMPAMQRCPDVRLVLVASRAPERAKSVAAEFDVEAAEDYDRLVRDPRVEAIYLPLPNALHEDWVRWCLAEGKHVLAEKPLTTRYEATRELTDLAASNGLVLMENIVFPHHLQHARVLELLADGVIGELRTLHAAFTIPPRPADDIRYRAALGGGALLDNGVYPISAAQLFLGTGLEVRGASLCRSGEVDVGGSVLAVGTDGVAGHLDFGMQHFYSARYVLHGSEGRITVDRAFTPPPDHRPQISLERRDGTEQVQIAPDDQYRGMMAAFARAVRTGGDGGTEQILDRARLLEDVHAAAD